MATTALHPVPTPTEPDWRTFTRSEPGAADHVHHGSAISACQIVDGDTQLVGIDIARAMPSILRDLMRHLRGNAHDRAMFLAALGGSKDLLSAERAKQFADLAHALDITGVLTLTVDPEAGTELADQIMSAATEADYCGNPRCDNLAGPGSYCCQCADGYR